MSEKEVLVFVYGTLKRGFYFYNIYLNGSLGKAEYLYDTTIKGTMYDLGTYPAIDIKGEGEVHGEVFKIERNLLAALDYLEGYPQLYDRSLITLPDGKKAYVYHLPKGKRGSDKIINDGIWKKN